jgi:hypothetical protein
MRTVLFWFTLTLSVVSLWSLGIAAPTAPDIIARARQQLLLPTELTQGEMTVYRGASVQRSCAFVMGKMWDEANQTEAVRIDFKTAVNSVGDSVLYSDQRYLLKRSAQSPATQWLYLPALRRVRIVPFQPDDPLLQSHMFFYDLTSIQDFGDYRYQFVDANEQAPVIAGEPLDDAAPVPYQRIIFSLQKKGETYLVTTIHSHADDREKIARFTNFHEIAPGYYRPGRLEITADGGRTEFTFTQWTVRPADPQLLIPTHLETQTLAMPTAP